MYIPNQSLVPGCSRPEHAYEKLVRPPSRPLHPSLPPPSLHHRRVEEREAGTFGRGGGAGTFRRRGGVESRPLLRRTRRATPNPTGVSRSQKIITLPRTTVGS